MALKHTIAAGGIRCSITCGASSMPPHSWTNPGLTRVPCKEAPECMSICLGAGQKILSVPAAVIGILKCVSWYLRVRPALIVL